MQTDDDGGEYPVFADAPEAVWDAGKIRAATAGELATIQEWEVAQAQAALLTKAQRYAGPLAVVLAAFTRFQIVPPIEFDQAAAIMNQQAETVGDMKLILMTKMVYERHLEPAGITGETLAACAGALMASMQGNG
jgi:hypothetical protein